MAWIGFPLFYSSPARPFLTCLTAKVLILRNQNGKKRHLKTYFGGYNVGGDTDVTSLSVPFFVTGQMSDLHSADRKRKFWITTVI